jgi:hypothetical protein
MTDPNDDMSSIADPGSMDAGSLTEPDNETPATSTTATGIWLTSASVHSDGRDFSSSPHDVTYKPAINE